MYKKQKIHYYNIIPYIIILLILLFFLGGSTKRGINETIHSTPYNYRFGSRTITYSIKSKSKYYQDVFNKAIQVWNNQHVIHFVPSNSKDVQITLSEDNQNNGNCTGLTTRYWPNGKTKIDIVLYSKKMREFHYNKIEHIHVAEHELGHAIGLEHVDNPKSIMFPHCRSQQITYQDKLAVENDYQGIK